MRASIVHGAVLAVVTTTAIAWVSLDKSVTVEVDGESRVVTTHAATVGEVLQRAGLDIGEHDTVAPAPGVAVKDGSHIIIQRVRMATVQINQTGVEPDQRMYVSASRSSRVPQNAERTTVSAANVRDVRISRTRPIAFRSLEVEDPTMPVGQSALKQKGVPGVRVVYFEQHIVGGKVVAQKPDGERVARKARDRIVLVGAKAKKQPAPATITTAKKKKAPEPTAKRREKTPVEKLNWVALASCESHNNPHATSAGGRYRGLYQFMISTWHAVGGAGDPINASRDEQTHRAQQLYKRRGAGAWGRCGSSLYH